MNNTNTEQKLPRLTIHAHARGDKEIEVTGGALFLRVDFDDVDHIAVAREIGLVVDACNAHEQLVAKVEAMQAVVNAASLWEAAQAREEDDEDSDESYETALALEDAIVAYRIALLAARGAT